MTHEITLNGYTARHDGDRLLFLGTADSFGTEQLHITADEAWDGLTITATFVRDESRTRVLTDIEGFVAVPPEATVLGGVCIGRIVFSGVRDGVQRVSTDLTYRIMPHSETDGTESEPSPDVWAQFVDAVAEDREAAVRAAASAQKLSERFGTLITDTEHIQELLGFARGPGSTTVLEPAQTYAGKYISEDGSLMGLGDENFFVSAFTARAGRLYHIYSPAPTRLMGDFPIASFGPTAGSPYTVIRQGSGIEENYDFEYTPTEDGTVFIAWHSLSHCLCVAEVIPTSAVLGRIDTLESAAERTLWTGKKVVWLGTSVSFGQHANMSYADEAAKALGFTLVNTSVPGLALHTDKTGNALLYGSLCLSKDEYAAQGRTLPEAPIDYTPGGAYNDFYRSYENIFTAENADADLYVFDLVPNNTRWGTSDWDGFDFYNWRYADGSDFADHRTTFLGAALFLLDRLYALNPDARVVFVLGSSFAYTQGKAALGLLQTQWNMPVLDLWGRINTCPKSLQRLKSENGADPHPSAFAHALMGRMLAGELTTIA